MHFNTATTESILTLPHHCLVFCCHCQGQGQIAVYHLPCREGDWQQPAIPTGPPEPWLRHERSWLTHLILDRDCSKNDPPARDSGLSRPELNTTKTASSLQQLNSSIRSLTPANTVPASTPPPIPPPLTLYYSTLYIFFHLWVTIYFYILHSIPLFILSS